MSRRELEALLQDLLEGRLDGADLECLQRELRESPAARDAYRDYVHLHNALQLRAEGIDLLHIVPMDRVIERRQRRHLRDASIAASAVLVLGSALMAIFLTRTPPPTLAFAVSPGTEFSMSHLLTGEAPPKGRVMEPGSRLEVTSGMAELRLASGVRGIVRGPADLTLHRGDLIHLAHGTAWFEVPAGAVGFTG